MLSTITHILPYIWKEGTGSYIGRLSLHISYNYQAGVYIAYLHNTQIRLHFNEREFGSKNVVVITDPSYNCSMLV